MLEYSRMNYAAAWVKAYKYEWKSGANFIKTETIKYQLRYAVGELYTVFCF